MTELDHHPREPPNYTVRSLASWIWLVNCPTADRALDASAETSGDLAAALQRHFSIVDVLRPTAEAVDAVRSSNETEGWKAGSVLLGDIRHPPWPEATFDCIAVHDALARRSRHGSDLALELLQWHRLLKRGGWMAATSPNPSPFKPTRAGSAAIPRHRFVRSFERAGFAEVRVYQVNAAIDHPLFLIPETRSAITAYEGSEAMREDTSWKRRLAAGLGLRAPLYPGYLLLARA